MDRDLGKERYLGREGFTEGGIYGGREGFRERGAEREGFRGVRGI